MLNPDLGVIFIHPPKTGGWSICEVLGRNAVPQHMTAQYYKNCRIDFDDYLVFASTRNPWERVVSAYVFLIAIGRLPSETSFEKYLTDGWELAKSNKPYLNHDKANARWIHPGPVLDWISVEGEIVVDYICHQPCLDEDFNVIRQLIGNRHLPYLNSTDHDDYKTYFNPTLIEMVHDIYRTDIEYFKFEYENSSKCSFEKLLNPSKLKTKLRIF